jgi:hypothetical protein
MRKKPNPGAGGRSHLLALPEGAGWRAQWQGKGRQSHPCPNSLPGGGRAGQSMPGPLARPLLRAKFGNARTRKVDLATMPGHRTNRARRSRLPPILASPHPTGWSGPCQAPFPVMRGVRFAHERAPVGSRSPAPAVPYHARGTAPGGGPRLSPTPGGVCTGRAHWASGLS